MFLVCGKGKKKFSQKTPVCWRCGQSGHVKRNCPGGADSVKGSDTTNMVSVVSDALEAKEKWTRNFNRFEATLTSIPSGPGSIDPSKGKMTMG
ncbi:hypothetical protein LXL04_022715 [Taraxacum kok-saghyz]